MDVSALLVAVRLRGPSQDAAGTGTVTHFQQRGRPACAQGGLAGRGHPANPAPLCSSASEYHAAARPDGLERERPLFPPKPGSPLPWRRAPGLTKPSAGTKPVPGRPLRHHGPRAHALRFLQQGNEPGAPRTAGRVSLGTTGPQHTCQRAKSPGLPSEGRSERPGPPVYPAPTPGPGGETEAQGAGPGGETAARECDSEP